MDVKKIKYDCKYFKGDMPCLPNKLRNKVCDSCDEYSKDEQVRTQKRILIIKLGAIGDVIRTTPLLIKLRNVYPESHITWITHYPETLPKERIDSIEKLDLGSVLLVQNSTYDIAINLDKDKEACILLKNSNAKQKFGFSWSDDNHIIGLSEEANNKILAGLFDHLSKSNRKSYQQEIFEICGFEFNGEPNLLVVDKDYYEKWKFLKTKAKGKIIIGLNTGCGKRWPTRMWPANHWNDLINLLQNANYFPVLLGGRDEHEINMEYSNKTAAYYPGHYSLQEFIAIVNSCDAIVTAVSMTMHIAAGLGKPLVLFNNIFNKNEFELYGKGIVIEPSSGCDCYYGNKCSRTDHCMQDIDAEKVYNSIKEIIFKME